MSDVRSARYPSEVGKLPVNEEVSREIDTTDGPLQLNPVQVVLHSPVAMRLPPEPLHSQPDHPKASLRDAIFVEDIKSHIAA